MTETAKRVLAGAALLLALVMPVAAFGAQSMDGGGGTGTTSRSSTATTSTSKSTTASKETSKTARGKSLPFTGGGEVAFAIASLAAGAGYVVRRLAVNR